MILKTCERLGLILITLFIFNACKNEGPRVLVFSKTAGYVHSNIPFANTAIEKLGKENGYTVDISQEASLFNDDDLKNYDAIIFNNTTGNILTAEQQAAFERFIQAGGGFVGIHAAADTEYEWSWFDKLIGAHFSSHPRRPSINKAMVNVVDKTHISTSMLPDNWEREDEWYSYRSFYSDINVLAYLDEKTYHGGTNGNNHPIAWYHEFDGGRSFYTGGGHVESSYTDPLFLEHLKGGITYAMGDGILDYSKATAMAAPEENRFEKTILINDLSIPMEVAVSDDGRVFYTELRSANLGMFNTNTGEQSIVHSFDVATQGGTGLIGVTLDPNFNNNNYIYLYYSPPKEEEPILFNLSRFTVNNDNTLDITSEVVFLQVPVQKNSGAHHGGSLAWDKEGNLFLSTGDSSSPFPSDGYAPIDERSGKEFYSLDSQRSASNTNDFKGKILRIKPKYETDNSGIAYTIPEGNLFPIGTEKTRPEIYAMGCRNPYRIAINPETSTLYWGEIGPDAGADGEQGPRGYDEFNQAKKPGNFGWPHFVGNNQAYAEWDFATKTAGPKYTPEAPINNSPNNTGLLNLPPAQSAMLWYPYAASEEFPELGVGGRSAMVGQFYTYDENSTSEKKFPKYYDGTLFVFEWMRNWVKAFRFDQNEDYSRAEPFMTANGDFRRPIDLAFGKNGVMYMLEYGSVYGADNEDARLVKIEYNRGNRAPIAHASVYDSIGVVELERRAYITSDKRRPPIKKEIAGKAPLRVLLSSRGSRDLDDNDKLTYEWLLNGNTVGETRGNLVHTFTETGTYNVILKVKDLKGLSNNDTIVVKVGNEPPKVVFKASQNKSFYWNKPLEYDLQISDEEDTTIDASSTKVLFSYNPSPSTLNQEEAAIGHQNEPLGYTLIENSDCKACHTTNKTSIGPSYVAISERYNGKTGALSTLAKKVINGGAGNWGENLMSAHPQLSSEDVEEMVTYILSLSNGENEKIRLNAKGILQFNQHKADEPRGVYTLSGSYSDNGANGISSEMGQEIITLRNAKVQTVFMDEYIGFRRFGNRLENGGHKSYYMLKNIDLTGITKFKFEYAAANTNGHIEVRMDSQAGPIISKTSYNATKDWDTIQFLTGEINSPIEGRHDIYFVMIKPETPNEEIINVKSITFMDN